MTGYQEFEVLVEDDDERRAIVTLRALDEDNARRRVAYMLDSTSARIVEIRAARERLWTL